MKSVIRICAVALAVAVLNVSAVAADDCCKKTADSVKAGKSCEKCTKGDCCKTTAKGVKDAKACEKCAPKK